MPAKRAAEAAVQPRDSLVLQVPAAEPSEAEHHFLSRLAFETDASDVHGDLARGVEGFTVVDCRPADEYAAGHVPTAASVPYRMMTQESTARLPREATYVVYDSGLHDNAATKSCLRMAALGFRVKEMQGGLAGWKAEGHPVAVGTAAGKLAKRA